MDGSIVAMVMSAYLSGTPAHPEKPSEPTPEYSRDIPAIIDDRRRMQIISEGENLPDPHKNGRGIYDGKFNRSSGINTGRRDYRLRRF